MKENDSKSVCGIKKDCKKVKLRIECREEIPKTFVKIMEIIVGPLVNSMKKQTRRNSYSSSNWNYLRRP